MIGTFVAVGVLIAMGALVVSVRAPSALGVVSVVVRVGIIGCTHDRGCLLVALGVVVAVGSGGYLRLQSVG